MKTICIYHSRDLDGWMSAAIVKKWFADNYNSPTFNTHREKYELVEENTLPTGSDLYFLGWDYGDEIPDLEKYDQVIMVDVSFPKEEMRKLFDYNDLIWIDHHISTIKENWAIDDETQGLRSTEFAACELTWQHFFPYLNSDTNSPWAGMPEIVRLLGRYDCFGHKGTNEEQKVLEFQYAARARISNYKQAYSYLIDMLDRKETSDDHRMKQLYVEGSAIYAYLCTEAKQDYKKAFSITLYEKFGNNYGEHYEYKFLCINKQRFNPINFNIDYHKEGYDGFACFHYEKGKWCFSLYNDNEKVDCSKIAKQYGGGGHAGAAGFICDSKIMLKIINNE